MLKQTALDLKKRNQLLKDCDKIYKSITGEDADINTQLSKKIVNAYIDLLKKDDVNSDKLNSWVSKNYFFGEMLKKKRNESGFYKDSIVVLLGWLVYDDIAGNTPFFKREMIGDTICFCI
jgi:hypothetical protein